MIFKLISDGLDETLHPLNIGRISSVEIKKCFNSLVNSSGTSFFNKPTNFSKETDDVKPGDTLRVIYFITINSIADNEGTISYSPLLQSTSGETFGISTVTTSFKDLKIKDGKVMLSYTIKLPKNYKKGYSVSNRLVAYSGIDFTFHRIVVVKSSLPLSTFSAYQIGLDVSVDNGIFADISDGVYLMNTPYSEFKSEVGTWSGWFEGYHVADNEDIKPGDRIKVTYCFDISSIKDPTASLYYIMKTWIGSTETGSDITLSLSSIGFKTGKISFSFVGKISNTKKVDEWIYPMLYFSSGVSGSFDKIIISDEKTDISKYIP